MSDRRTKWAIGLIVGMSMLVAPEAVRAFDGGARLGHVGPNNTDCIVGLWDQGNITYPGEWGTAMVYITGLGQAGGLSWRFNVPTPHSNPAVPISAAMLESACGYVGATVISQFGADAASFGDEDYIGVVWQAKEQSDGSVFQYEYAISGVTGTSLINTRLLILSETVKPVITAPSAQSQAPDSGSTTASIDVTGLGSANDNVDGTVSIVYKVGATVLMGAYTFPSGGTTVTMDAVDSVGNHADQQSFVVTVTDSTAPTASVGALTSNGDGTYNAIITLTEVATNFDSADLAVTNGSATLSGSGTSYTAVVTPAADGLISLAVTAGSFSDATGNVSVAISNTVSFSHDGTAPSVTISGAPTSIGSTTAFTVTVLFSENVTGFDASDLTISNGSVIGFTGALQTYMATISPTGAGDVTVQIPAGAAQDSNGNLSLASSAMAVQNVIASDTEKLNAQAAFRQTNALISAQPNLVKHLLGGGSRSLAASVSRGIGTFDYTSNSGNLFWFELHGSKTKADGMDSKYSFGAIGRNFKINDNLIIGGMGQFDYSDTTDGTATHKNKSWLVGPYAVVKAANQPLYFEASILYGQGQNDVSPLGTYSDQYDSELWMYNLGVTGEIQTQNVTWRASAKINHASSESDAYVDGLGNAIQAGKVGVTQGTIGLDAIIPQDVAMGEFDLLLGVSGIYSQSTTSGSAVGATSGFENGRARVDVGISRRWKRGALVANAFYDGIGASGFESTGAEVGFKLDF